MEIDENDSITLSKLEYRVAINKAVFQKLVDNAVQEYDGNKESKELIKKNSKKFTGAWVSAFEKLINDYEGDDFDMKGSIGRVYENAKKTTASYFKASAKCNEQICKTTYSLIIDKKPKDNDSQGFIEVIITSDQQHNHTSMKNKQLRGEKRLRVAVVVLLTRTDQLMIMWKN